MSLSLREVNIRFPYLKVLFLVGVGIGVVVGVTGLLRWRGSGEKVEVTEDEAENDDKKPVFEEKDSTEYILGHEGDSYTTEPKEFEGYKQLEHRTQTLKFICHENKNDYFRFFIVSRIYFH